MVDDDEEDAPEPLPIDPLRGWRRLAQAVVLRAVIDSKQRNSRARKDAARFLYPKSDCVRLHFNRISQCAGLNQEWLRECLARTVDCPLPALRQCLRCKSPVTPDGMVGRYCVNCREAVPFYPKQREAALHRKSILERHDDISPNFQG
jgi:hypothetical protein